MNLLLHICCAPCMIYPLEVLRLKGFSVTGYFYNPNIHPVTEFNNRKKAISSLGAGIEVIYPEYSPKEYFRAVNLKEESSIRCPVCWRLRLQRTARVAKEKGYKYFTTTLLVSPYQNQEVLKKIGSDIACEEGVEFVYGDFRTGFRKAHDEAKNKGIYCQKYCGCIYSEIERGKN